MNGLDAKTLLLGPLKIHQSKYFKILILVLFVSFNFRLDTPLHSGEALLTTQQNTHKESFVSKALNISGDAVVTIETERKVSTSA